MSSQRVEELAARRRALPRLPLQRLSKQRGVPGSDILQADRLAPLARKLEQRPPEGELVGSGVRSVQDQSPPGTGRGDDAASELHGLSLTREDVAVQTKSATGKLVRDLIPELIRADGR